MKNLLFYFIALNLVVESLGQDVDWEPYPDQVDILAIFAHPDDEGYWGGLLPYYATCKDKKIVMISLTSGEWGNGLPHPVDPGEEPDCSYDDSDYPCFPAIPKEELIYPNYYRETELANAARIYGVKYKPVTPRYRDMNGIGWDDANKGFEFWGGKDEIVGYLTEQIRRFKPTIVIGLDWNGGNGNPQHAAAAQGAFYATQAASNPALYPGKFKAWEVKKMYSHLRNEDLDQTEDYHYHDWEIHCTSKPELNPRDLGAKGNAAHVSQEMKEECDRGNGFILRVTTVGPDLQNQNNLFENLTDQ